MKKGKKSKGSFSSNLDNIGEKYKELIGVLENDMASLVPDKRVPSKLVPKLEINSPFAYSYIVENYFLKDPGNYKEKDDRLSNQRITANAIIMYLRKTRSEQR